MAGKHLAGLNAEQRRAVMATKGPVLVLAGAGTGKTRVITTRIAQLLAEGVAAKNVLAVTFTNKAAREMRERVTALVGKKKGEELTVGTFHRFCLDLLREHGTKVGLPKRFSICDASDQQSVMRKALRELDVGDETMNPRAAQARVSLFKNRMVGPDEALDGAADDSDELLGRAYRRYEEHLRSVGTVDFDDLLLMTERLLRENGRVRAAVRKRFQYVLCDEYQDTNGVQYAILVHVAGKHRNHIVCLEDGKKFKFLKRHLRAAHGLSPDQYRAKWGLGDDYPLVAPGYSARRSRIAVEMGLGRPGGLASRKTGKSVLSDAA